MGLIPGLTQWVKALTLAVSCGIGHRGGSDLVLLWLWHRPAAVAPNRPLSWELPYSLGATLKRPKKGSSRCGAAVTNPTSIHEDTGSIPGLAQWAKELWSRLAATSLI